LDAGPSFVIHPSDGNDGEYFKLEAPAGSTSELTVVLGNADDEAMDLRTYVSDAVPMTNGGFAVSEEDATATGPATWIEYPAETFAFEPGAGVERTFSVTIPEDTQPGQYIAGLALQTAEPIEVEGSSFFNQIIRKAIAVFIIVPGPESPEFSLGEPEVNTDGGSTGISIPLSNSGNILVKPKGELVLSDASGATVFRSPISMGSVYAGTTAPLSVKLQTAIPDGDYTISVELVDDATSATASLGDTSISIASPTEDTSAIVLAGNVALSPDAANPVFANVSVEITNNGDAVDQAQVLLDVTKDGELVETFPLVSNLPVPSGTTNVTQRYVPATGWGAGSWEFVIHLNAVDVSTDAATSLATLDTIPAIEVAGGS
jgi:hypothetical protein